MVGFHFWGPLLTKRVAVFVDYQNVYMGARHCFFPGGTDNHVDGQIDPLKLGKCLAGPDRELSEVRVYRGLPSSAEDSKGYGAADRQMALWRQSNKVKPLTRPLNYRDRAHPKEKGIDVMLAVDLAVSMYRGDYDVAILFSADTDLLPAA